MEAVTRTLRDFLDEESRRGPCALWTQAAPFANVDFPPLAVNLEVALKPRQARGWDPEQWRGQQRPLGPRPSSSSDPRAVGFLVGLETKLLTPGPRNAIGPERRHAEEAPGVQDGIMLGVGVWTSLAATTGQNVAVLGVTKVASAPADRSLFLGHGEFQRWRTLAAAIWPAAFALRRAQKGFTHPKKRQEFV